MDAVALSNDHLILGIGGERFRCGGSTKRARLNKGSPIYQIFPPSPINMTISLPVRPNTWELLPSPLFIASTCRRMIFPLKFPNITDVSSIFPRTSIALGRPFFFPIPVSDTRKYEMFVEWHFTIDYRNGHPRVAARVAVITWGSEKLWSTIALDRSSVV